MKRIKYQTQKNWRGKDYQAYPEGHARQGKRVPKDEIVAQERINRMVDDKEALLKSFPEGVRNNGAVDGLAEALIKAKYLPTDGRTYAVGGGLMAGGLGLAGLQAYTDQTNEYMPRDPLAVAGRTISNLNPFNGSPVGVDPLAEARNNLSTAGELVGSPTVLDALTMDEMSNMEARTSAANNGGMSSEELMALEGVNHMIDARAQELMATPWVDATGNRVHFTHNEAQRLATEQVNMQLRASNVY